MQRRAFFALTLVATTTTLAQSPAKGQQTGRIASFAVFEGEAKGTMVIEARDIQGLSVFDGKPAVKLAPTDEREENGSKVLVWDLKRIGVKPGNAFISVTGAKNGDPRTVGVPQAASKCTARYLSKDLKTARISCE